MSLGGWLKRQFGGEQRGPATETEPPPARMPKWANANYPAGCREIGRREPERRQVVTVTPAAAEGIRRSMTGGQRWYVRVWVEVTWDTDGMPLFRNRMDLDPDVYPEFDFLDETHGLLVVVDRRSAIYLGTLTVDWGRTNGQTGLILKCP